MIIGETTCPVQFDKQFGKQFGKLTALSIVEGLTTGRVEGFVFSGTGSLKYIVQLVGNDIITTKRNNRSD